ncbi:MAG: hypothetical protein HY288_15650 [Planctomycetia bacterium]|nr:hypothetical protein [Planctomycetia bacterium]
MQTTQEPIMGLGQAQATLDEVQGDLQGGRESAATLAAEFDRVRRQWEEARARRESELAQREQRLEAIGIQQDEIAGRLERRTAELRQQWTELERQQAAFKAQCNASQQVHALADDRTWRESNEQKSTEQTSDSKPPEQFVGETPTERVAEPKPAVGTTATQRVTEDDQSIEQYMAALLNRMRGGSDADVVIAPERKQTKPEEVTPVAPEVQPQAVSMEPDASRQRAIDERMAPVEMERRSTTPAEVSDLAAMRELANRHARNAIDTHGKKQLLKLALGTWAGGIGAAVGSLVVFCLLPKEEFVLRAGCMTGFVASSYWIYRGVTATQTLVASNPAFETPRRAGLTQAPDDQKSS